MIPELPAKFIDHGMTEQELGELWHSLIVELLDDEFSNRTHHNARTYDAGCKGPLCRKSVREKGRRRNQTAVHERYIYVDPILDYWWPIAAERIANVRAKLVEELTG